jgi:hypothetical protein
MDVDFAPPVGYEEPTAKKVPHKPVSKNLNQKKKLTKKKKY